MVPYCSFPDQLKDLVNEFSQDEKEDEIKKDDDFKNDVEAVSYTHLTLPTKA